MIKNCTSRRSCFSRTSSRWSFLALLMLVLSLPAHATWYEEVMDEGADLIMMDLRWPWWPSGTYYANWNTGFGTDKGHLSFYGGFITTLKSGPDHTPNPDPAKQGAYYPGNVWSFWGTNNQGVAPVYIDCAPTLALKNRSAGEGCTASLRARDGAWPFMTWKRWYTMVGRLWLPTDPDAEHAYCGRWIKDVENNQWHMIAILKVPFRVDKFGKNQGFIESLGGDNVRPLDRRFGYYRIDGEWRKSNKLAIDKRSFVVMQAMPEGDHEYHAIEYAPTTKNLPWALKGGKILPKDERVEIEVRQPDQPLLDPPGFGNVRASHSANQVVVSWDVPDGVSPMLEYKIEVFDNPDCAGAPKAVRHRRMPNARHATIDVAVGNPTVRMKVRDIFDQETAAIVVAPKPMAVVKSKIVSAKLAPGLAYELHKRQRGRDPRGTWQRLADLPSSKVIKRGISRGLDLSMRGKESSNFAITYEGYVQIPRDGTYVFYTRIDDAYSLSIGGKAVIVRDRNEGTKEEAGLAILGAGLHPIKLTYLAGNPLAFNFQVDWEGPGLERQRIPDRAFKCIADSIPTASVHAEAFGDGTGFVNAKVDPRGHALDRVRIFLGDYCVVEGDSAELSYRGALPAGEHDFWVQVKYGEDRYVDLTGDQLQVVGKPAGDGWTVRNMGHHGAVAGLWQVGKGEFSFFGQGIHGAFKEMTGDFTVTCRIEDYANSGVHRDAWIGVSAFENAAERSWKWGRHYYLVQTARVGIRTSPDFGDLGSSRKSEYAFPEDHRWLRICRQGNLFTAWSSPDGKEWTLGGTRHQWMQEKMHAGLFVRIPDHGSDAYYHARVSNLSVEAGVPDGFEYPAPPVAKGTRGERLTGVVMARSDANVVVVRSTSQGLLRSTDGGKSWRRINAGLPGIANAVRSVAIHPSNPDVMFRAAGKAVNGVLESGLWKTMDGGASWSKLDFPGDFDGHGPSALCGEVVAFDLKNPERIFAGTESKGFFKSDDGGNTWQHLGWLGSRFTAVAVWPWGRFNSAKNTETRLAATTCTDNWMELLGRGEPVQSVKPGKSRGLSSHKDVSQLNEYNGREDSGFYNVAFSRMMAHPQNYRYATPHGLQHNYGSNQFGFPAYKNLEWLRPITAIHCANLPEKKNELLITQALDPERPGRISRSKKSWGRIWHWTEIAGDAPQGGLIATHGDMDNGAKWWFVYTDGLYFSADGGQTMRKVLSETGQPPSN